MKGKTDEKKINGVFYDTSTASLTAETESMKVFSGKRSLIFHSEDYIKDEFPGSS